jgi:outer membrane protein TolC
MEPRDFGIAVLHTYSHMHAETHPLWNFRSRRGQLAAALVCLCALMFGTPKAQAQHRADVHADVLADVLALKVSMSLAATSVAPVLPVRTGSEPPDICPRANASGPRVADPAPLTLQQVIERARLNNPDVARALAQIRKARADFDTAESAYTPTVRIGASGGTLDGTGKGSLAGAANLQVSKLLHDFGKTDGLIEEARLRTQARTQEHLDTVDRITLDIVETWLNAARQSELTRLHQDALQALDDAVRILRLRAQAGLVGSGEVDLAQARLLQVREAGVATCVQREQLLSRLSLLAGSPVGAISAAIPEPLLGQGPATPWDPTLLPGLRQADAEHQAAIQHAQSVRASRWPSVYLQASRTGKGLNGQSATANAVNLTLNMDVLDGGTDSRIDSAGADVQAALLHIQSLRDAADDSLRRTRTDLQGIEVRRPLLKAQALSTASTRRNFLDQFLAGRRQVLDLLNTHQEVLAADLALAGLDFDRMLLVARLYGLYGELTDRVAALPGNGGVAGAVGTASADMVITDMDKPPALSAQAEAIPQNRTP